MTKLKRIFRVFEKSNECPLCNYVGKDFLPFGNPPRAKALCPKCHSLERMRMIWHFLVNEIGITHQVTHCLAYCTG
jgi:hypothetical protein